MATAKGKYAKAISDRSGFAFPYNEMIEEHDGVLVHKSKFEPEHPQGSPFTADSLQAVGGARRMFYPCPRCCTGGSTYCQLQYLVAQSGPRLLRCPRNYSA